MTVIFQSSDFWIEYIEFESISLAPEGIYTSIIEVEHPGRFVGMSSGNLDSHHLFALSSVQIDGILFNGNFTDLIYGTQIKSTH